MRLVHHISRFKLHSALNSHVIKWHTVIIVVDFNRPEMAEVSSYSLCMRCLQSWVANGLRMASWRALGRSECSKAWLVSRYEISDLSILCLICVYTNIHVNILLMIAHCGSWDCKSSFGSYHSNCFSPIGRRVPIQTISNSSFSILTGVGYTIW